jgi:hypothetical protein
MRKLVNIKIGEHDFDIINIQNNKNYLEEAAPLICKLFLKTIVLIKK